MTVPISPGSGGGNVVEIRVTSKDMTASGFASATAGAVKVAKTIDGPGSGSIGTAVDSVTKKSKGLGSAFADVGKIAGGILVADLVQRGAQKVDQLVHSTMAAASNLNESLNAVDKTFGKSASIIHDWGNENAAAFGLSTRAFNEAATPMGALLKNFGLSEKEVSEQTIKLTERAADMGSVFNVDVAETLTAIQAGLRGESEPLRRFGVSLSQAAIEQQALTDTGKKSVSQLTAHEKAMASLSLIYAQTSQTQGDFADTATQMANATRIAQANIENMQAKVGAVFIPVMAFAENVLSKMAGTISGLPGPVIIAGAAVVGLAGSLLVLAPRIVATKVALEEMTSSENKWAQFAGKATVAAGKVAAGFVALQVVATVLSEIFSHQLSPQVDQMSKQLTTWDGKAQLAGESARVFGDHAQDLTHALQTAAATGFNDVINKISITSAGLIGLDGSFKEDEERVKAFDQALAGLVQSGNGAQALSLLETAAKNAGMSVDQLKKALPEYTAAVENTANGTSKAGDAAATAAVNFDDLRKAMRGIIDDSFQLGETEDKAANDIQRLSDQVIAATKAHTDGAKSLDGNTQAARDNRQLVRDLVRDYEDLMVQYTQSGKATDGLKKKLEDQLVQMGFNRQQVQGFTGDLDTVKTSMDQIPKVITITVKTDIQQAIQQLNETDVEAHRVNRKRSGGIIGAASGGARGGATWVGEGGPELVDLPYGSMVHSAGDSARMASQGGGGGSTRLTLGSDGTRMGDALIWLIALAVRQRGGDPSILGINL